MLFSYCKEIMFKEFEGYLFDESVETGRVKIIITTEQSGLAIKGDNIQRKISWNDLEISLGGSNNKQVFIKSRSDAKLNLFTNQLNLINEIKTKSGFASDTILKPIKKGATKRFFLSTRFILFVITIMIVVPSLLLYLNYGKIKKSAAKAIPVELETNLGESVFKNSVDQTKIIQVPEVKQAIDTIFERFKPALINEPFQFHFYLIKDESLNAFALPGGYVVIHTGLILESESIEELAGVIAHEISHVTERHALERIVSSLGIITVCQIFLGDVSGIASVIIQGAQFASMMQFSQSQETEADVTGFNLMRQAKISPHGFIDFFNRAKAKKAMPEEMHVTLNLFSSHPPDDKRIQKITELSQKYPYQPEKIEVKWDEVKTALKSYLNK